MGSVEGDRPRRRWWLQFSLRGMFVLTLVVALGLGWIVNERRKVWLEDRAVEEIEGLGGWVGRAVDFKSFSAGGDPFTASVPAGLSWQQRLFGKSYPRRIDTVVFPPGIAPGDLRTLEHLRALQAIGLTGARIGDEQIPLLYLGPSACTQEYVQRLAQLDTTEELRLRSLYRPQEVFGCLAGMTSVESLHITRKPYEKGRFIALRDGDLDFLAELPNLKDFALSINEGRFNSHWTEDSQTALLAMTKCRKLEQVSFYRVDIRKATLARVAQIAGLESIEVTPTPHLPHEVIDEILGELRKRTGERELE